MTTKEIVSQLTLEEKASLCSGRDFWTLKGIDRLGLHPIMVTDGPHGLRKQAAASDHLGVNQSVPATCFPAACASASSFDRDLLYAIGRAMGEECLQESVAVILGPGANIKRSPLCGRNFEYFSEDPFVTGQLAAALIRGVQSTGVGTSLKHYAANNQEKARLTSDSVVDERALREIYLAGFETAVKTAAPWTLMCSYNKLNGVYASENKKLLTAILRDDWGFTGAVMTDWGAIDDRVEGIRAGLDLEMPGSGGFNDAKIVQAVQDGKLEESVLDVVVARLVDLILKAQEQSSSRYDPALHHAVARTAASGSAVLLKNDGGLLPVQPGQRIAVIGALAKTPRYQGAGSSRINPSKLDSTVDALTAAGITFDYAPGYSLTPGAAPDAGLMAEACHVAAGKDVVLIFAGLPDEYESEGFDRSSLDMPESHNRLIQAVAAVNPHVAVVLQLGAPVLTPWAKDVKAVLALYLSGQAIGSASADLLLGTISPSGKLAETWPCALEDTPCYHSYPGVKTAEYRESIFVGYRYYDQVSAAPAYPFGHGLSYTSFAYSAVRLSSESFAAGQTLEVSCTIKNTGASAGAEVVQVYVAPRTSVLFRADKELKGFEKVSLSAGEEKTVSITLDSRSFAYYNVPRAAWCIEGGEYVVLIGASSRDIRLRASIAVAGDGYETLLLDQRQKMPEYFDRGAQNRVSDASFKALYGQQLPPSTPDPDAPFTINSTLDEIKYAPVGRQFLQVVTQQMAATFGGDGVGADIRIMMERMMMDAPLRSLCTMSGGALTPPMIDALVDVLNGKPNADPALHYMLGK
jgi:beta-glucosidase